MDGRSNSVGIHFIYGQWRVLCILILLSILGGCIGKESRTDAGLSAQDVDSSNLTLAQDATVQNASLQINESKPNQVRLFIRPKQLNLTGKLPVTLKITNPKLNETVLTVFKPQYGQEWYNQTNVTYKTNNNWTQNFTIKPKSNISYVQVFVQISENDTVIKKVAWNITLGVPIGRPK